MQSSGSPPSKTIVITQIRGKGLMIGIQLSAPGAGIVDRCLENGLRINCTQNTVLRFMPSMTVTRQQIDEALTILESALAQEG